MKYAACETLFTVHGYKREIVWKILTLGLDSTILVQNLCISRYIIKMQSRCYISNNAVVIKVDVTKISVVWTLLYFFNSRKILPPIKLFEMLCFSLIFVYCSDKRIAPSLNTADISQYKVKVTFSKLYYCLI
jgi:hypothetical protein